MAKVDYNVLYVAALLIVVFCGTSSWAQPRRRHYRALFEQHMNRVYAFVCKEPQMRLVQLKDLGVIVSPEVSYYPQATVLRRCDCATGYCPNPEHVCRANSTVVVELVLRIQNHVKGGSAEYKTVNAMDDVSCSCQPITNQIK
ncbi:hypothetical protein L798_11222 [Zootermopsis nevadensis]|uniref:Platelet-derived growth factor (PDGF) family profile domain-containing protein n=1 Tax=Zootermopsis nevadensis TaxID=136037 RepID=A0A067R8Z6_ZOONE|nr:hypothetical protein L798_11222 [Zootermopsis nevadensis]